MSTEMIIIFFVGAILLGLTGGYFLRYLHALSKKASVELDIKERIVRAEEKALKIIEKAEEKTDKYEKERKDELKDESERLEKIEERHIKKEDILDKRQINLDSEIDEVREKIDQIKSIKTQLDERAEGINTELEKVAQLTSEEALEKVIKRVETDNEENLMARIAKLERLGDEQFEDKAKDILSTAIFRIGNTMKPDIMTSAIELPSEDMKGKIIGKEGRNVRAFERITGVDVLIDDTPGHITLSSFDPVRREIARVAMENLLTDGRIQPTKIEEIVEKAKTEVSKIVKKMGEKAAYESGVPNLHPDLIAILGRLHFRTSYGQNVLWHSVEMAHLAAIIAEETGANVEVARAGALLHDIGKTISQEVQGTHVEIGRHMLKKYNVDEEVIKAMQAHHEEYPYENLESIIVQVADAISGGRPGARRDSLERYIQRLADLEAIAKDMPGVEKAFAIQAGREVRVMINPEKISDFESRKLAEKIAKEVESKLRYPGEIKIHVIRETRVVSYAR